MDEVTEAKNSTFIASVFSICRTRFNHMFHLSKSEVLPLTPELARQFKEMEPSPTERDLNPARLKMLRDKADKGLLIPFNWSTAVLGERRLRINGQHSSNMLCELNGAFPSGLKVHHDEYKVENEGDVVLLYRQLDERKSGRSVGDIAWAYQGVVPELNAVPKGTAKLAAEGIAWYQRTVAKEPTASGDEIYKMFNEKVLHPFIIWLGELFSIKTPELKTKVSSGRCIQPSSPTTSRPNGSGMMLRRAAMSTRKAIRR